jgi:uncharacterized membrane protein
LSDLLYNKKYRPLKRQKKKHNEEHEMEKKEQSEQRKKKRRELIIIGASVLVCVIALTIILIKIVLPVFSDKKTVSGGNAVMENTIRIIPSLDGDLRIPVDSLQNLLNYIIYDGDEEIIVWKDNSGVIRTAFDTCEDCFIGGNIHFKLSGNILTCSLCSTTSPLLALGTEGWGGCRPISIIPDMRDDTDTEVVIPAAVLSYAKNMFASWKASDYSVSFENYGTDETGAEDAVE